MQGVKTGFWEGTPAVWAPNDVGAYFGLGQLHGRHRALQALLLPTAGLGRLSELLAPLPALTDLDALAHRLDLPRRGLVAQGRLSEWTATRLDAYLAGLSESVAGPQPVDVRPLVARLVVPDRAALISGFLLSSYLGLSEGQERMERALLDALSAGADLSLLSQMFEPHLNNWSPKYLPKAPSPRGFAGRALSVVGGSNAWAVDGSRTASGAPILAGDPHLVINQLPALFFEVTARVGDGWWMGATIPGLPAIAVGRSREVAWSGTFSVADNVDFFVEQLSQGRAHDAPLARREAVVKRRGLPSLRIQFWDTPRGTLESVAPEDGPALSVGWAAADRPEEAIAAYLRLPSAESAEEAEHMLARAHTLSLHFVLADRAGDVRYLQLGTVPKRRGGGLHPLEHQQPWLGLYRGESLPRSGPQGGFVATANEARPAPDGGILATLAQPEYRLARIHQVLGARRDHDPASMMALQDDLHSLQGEALSPLLLSKLPRGPLRAALAAWDFSCATDSVGAHAFSVARRAALTALSPCLGGPWLEQALERTELGVWWLDGLDRALSAPATWTALRTERLAAALAGVAHAYPSPWGDVQKLHLQHLVYGGLGFADRGPFALPGSVATVCQGNVFRLGQTSVAVGPAYRFVSALDTDEAWTSLPGGVDGGAFSKTYTSGLLSHLAGQRRRLTPPSP